MLSRQVPGAPQLGSPAALSPSSAYSHQTRQQVSGTGAAAAQDRAREHVPRDEGQARGGRGEQAHCVWGWLAGEMRSEKTAGQYLTGSQGHDMIYRVLGPQAARAAAGGNTHSADTGQPGKPYLVAFPISALSLAEV